MSASHLGAPNCTSNMKMDLWVASWGGGTRENLFTTIFVNCPKTYDFNICFLIGCLISISVSGFNIHIPM
jgi:hypothetical protein